MFIGMFSRPKQAQTDHLASKISIPSLQVCDLQLLENIEFYRTC